ncbi:MAG: MFS transporter [Solirubrobacteraceae bacterium]|nr:MFS transporter [Solirubrobacteraceae bacterium]
MAASLPSASSDAPAERSQSLALLGVCGAAFLVFLDTTIVNVAFPDLSADFAGASAHELVWVLDGYFIAVAALLVPAGGIGDDMGRRRLLIAGLVGFALTSLTCAIAPSWQVLTAARIVQGIAGAMIVPASMALLLSLYPPERRATGIGIWGAAAALAAAIGPVLGGALVEVAGWRWIFLVNLPLIAAIAWASARGLDESRDAHSKGIPELLGSVLVALALGLLALALVRGNDWGWLSTATLGCFAGAAIASTGAVLRSARHPRPAVDLALLKIPSFRLGTLGTALFAMGFFSMILGNILFLTEVWHYSVLHAGLAVAPGPVASTLVAGAAGRVADRLGHRAVILPGAVVYAAGILVLRLAPGQGGDYLTDWLPGQLLSGVGIGLAFPALGAAAVQDVPESQFGSASAVNAAARQVGAVIGTAVLVAFAGTATDYPSAMRAFDDSYLVAAAAVILSGVSVLALPKAQHRIAGADGADTTIDALPDVGADRAPAAAGAAR